MKYETRMKPKLINEKEDTRTQSYKQHSTKKRSTNPANVYFTNQQQFEENVENGQTTHSICLKRQMPASRRRLCIVIAISAIIHIYCCRYLTGDDTVQCFLLVLVSSIFAICQPFQVCKHVHHPFIPVVYGLFA